MDNMARKSNFFPAFLVLLFLSFLLFVLGRSGILAGPAGFLAKVASPIERAAFGLSSLKGQDSKIAAENKILVKKLADAQRLAAENKALRDQFEITYPKSTNLLPADVVSAPSFIPGVTSPEYLVIDKGGKDGVKAGMAVVFKDNLVGKVVQTTSSLSKVMLISNSASNFSAETISVKGAIGEGALGVAKGIGGQELVLDNVLLSENLQQGDYVTTKGDMQVDNTGLPPALIVGKISSVEKKASDLFQRAKVRSLLDFSKLNMVFVILEND